MTTTAPSVSPVVSVVVATRNRSSDLLGRALDSIRGQELQDFEVILVDDGSSAETLAEQAALRAGLDSRFVQDGPMFPGARGTGPSAAYNRGIRRARGKFIAFCDDDDHWIARDYLSNAVDMLNRYNADLFLGAIQVESADKTTPPRGSDLIAARMTTGQRLCERPAVYDVPLATLMGVVRHCHPSQRSAWITRRELIDRAGLFWERVDSGEDVEWFIRNADGARKILYRADPVAGYNAAVPNALSKRNHPLERILQSMFQAQHLRATCTHRSVRSCARSLEAWKLRALAELVLEAGRPATAVALAWRGCWLYPTAGGVVNWAKLLARAAFSGKAKKSSPEPITPPHHLTTTVAATAAQPTLDTPPAATPMVSVVVTTRNRPAALLGRALASIRAQDFQDFEVILVDDGSSAETLAEQSQLRAGLDPRFILDGPMFPGARGTGPAAARNRGIRRARGQFIAFCDDDDHWIARDHLSVGVEMLRRHDADLFLGNVQLESDGKTSPPTRPAGSPMLPTRPRLNDHPPVHEVSLAALMRVIRHYNPSHLDTWIVRRELIERAGLFWERVDFGEDIEWIIRLADGARKTLFRSDPVAGYNIAPHDSIWTRTNPVERMLQNLFEAQHVNIICSHRSVRCGARSMEAWQLRLLAKDLRVNGRPLAAACFAWQALCTYPTIGAAVDWMKLLPRAVASRGP